MGDFGEDFDLDVFTAAYASEDPVELNRVKAVERGVEQLSEFIAGLTAFGLELAGLRGRREEIDTPAELNSLVSAGVLSARLARRLKRLYDLQRMLIDEHASAEHVHESAVIVAETLADFYDAYGAWVKQGFAPSR